MATQDESKTFSQDVAQVALRRQEVMAYYRRNQQYTPPLYADDPCAMGMLRALQNGTQVHVEDRTDEHSNSPKDYKRPFDCARHCPIGAHRKLQLPLRVIWISESRLILRASLY
jgi:hypothetical protein